MSKVCLTRNLKKTDPTETKTETFLSYELKSIISNIQRYPLRKINLRGSRKWYRYQVHDINHFAEFMVVKGNRTKLKKINKKE